MALKIGVVVLTYNRAPALLGVLRSLATQCGEGHSVWIADDGSRADQVDLMRQGMPQFACPVHHVWHADVGFTAARARNLAAAQADADYLIFLDGDCVPNAEFIAQHILLAQSGTFVNGSRVLLSEKVTRRVEQNALDLLQLSAVDWARMRLQGDCNKLSHLLHWPAAPGRISSEFRWKGIRSCNFGVWSQDFHAVNGFDESFNGWGHEDADLVLRLHHWGLQRKNGFWSTEVYHLWHREFARDQESTNRQRVQARMQGTQVKADVGLDQLADRQSVLVTRIN
ncbi:glycosyltransferase [Rhodoferax sp.]|uniref:glycosyltransferase n=1 Tax=Rhodoferax sp. TaxID=50421 RepID=UPI00374D1EB2